MSFRFLTSIGATLIFATSAFAADAAAPATAPTDIRAFAHWVASSEHAPQKFWAVLDKRAAKLYLFGPSARVIATSPVLLGSARGDDSVPGIGERKISDIRAFEKTTPAGRFQTEPGQNLQGEDIVWVDYDAAISMHRVRALKGERRLQRLATPTPDDNRISYGCINVPAAFYDRWVKPRFGQLPGVIYVLPETRTSAAQFGAPLPF